MSIDTPSPITPLPAGWTLTGSRLSPADPAAILTDVLLEDLEIVLPPTIVIAGCILRRCTLVNTNAESGAGVIEGCIFKDNRTNAPWPAADRDVEVERLCAGAFRWPPKTAVHHTVFEGCSWENPSAGKGS